MSDQKKVFKIHCTKCKKTFHVSYQIAEPEADGKADVWVECPYCNERQIINIPRKYVEKDTPIVRHE
ncbi:MAG: hypothetical protein AB7S75_25455 [Desulfococcaceae bacterium]